MAAAQKGNVELRMKLAREKLTVARDLLEKGHYNDAISKAYYAMFYASKALLLATGEDPHKHTGVVNLFGDRIVRVGYTDPKYGKTIRRWKELREDADYDEEYRASKEDAEQALRDAKDFVREAQVVLKKILTEQRNVHRSKNS